jgi:hypothetical protein
LNLQRGDKLAAAFSKDAAAFCRSTLCGRQ